MKNIFLFLNTKLKLYLRKRFYPNIIYERRFLQRHGKYEKDSRHKRHGEEVEEELREEEMAARLSRIMGGSGLIGRSAALRSRSGMGLPVGKHIVPDKEVNFFL